MSDLSEVCLRLNQQFLDPNNLAIPSTSQEEAIRLALEKMNHILEEDYTLAGLDETLETTLPQDHLVVLLYGAGANALDFCLRSGLSSYPKVMADKEILSLWSEHLSRQFDLCLDRLCLLRLQSEGGSPYAAWLWQEPLGWKSDR
ncbi:MAG: hypothetical protein WA116_04630 [Anaerolineaceae bacterium]